MVKIAHILRFGGLLTSLVIPASLFAQVGKATQLESLLVEAKQAQARSDFGSAAVAYREALKFSKDTPELWANLGLMDFQTGNHAEAVPSFKEAIRLKPSLYVANLFLGLDYIQTRQPALAIPFLKIAKDLNPKDSQSFLGLGHAYSAMKQPQLAEQEFHRAAEIDPVSLPAWFGLGISHMELAETYSRKLSTGNRNSPYLHALFGESLASQKKYVQAIDQYKQVLTTPDGPACIRPALGFVYLRQQALAEARDAFGLHSNGTQFHTDEGCSLALLGAACIESDSGSKAATLEMIGDLWKRDRGFARQNLLLLFEGLTKQQLSDLQDAILKAHVAGALSAELYENLEEEMSGARGSSSARIAAAESPDFSVKELRENPASLFSQGHYGECSSRLRARFKALASRDLQLLATCSFFTGDFETTFMASAHMLEGSPDDPVALYWAIKSSQKLAVQALTRVDQIDPDSPKTHVLLGDVYRKRAHYGQAKEEYLKTLSLAPKDPAGLLGLTATYLMTSQADNAIATGLQLLEQDASDPEANLLVAECYVARRNYKQAQPLLEKSLRVKPELQPRVHILLGSIYAEDNRNEQAVTELKQGLESDQDGSVHYKIARVYRKLGDKTSADAAMRIVQQLEEARLKRAPIAMQDSTPESPEDH